MTSDTSRQLTNGVSERALSIGLQQSPIEARCQK